MNSIGTNPSSPNSKALEKELEKMSAEHKSGLRETRLELLESMDSKSNLLRTEIGDNIAKQTKQLESRLNTFESNTEQKLQALRRTVTEQLNQIRNENQLLLDTFRQEVSASIAKQSRQMENRLSSFESHTEQKLHTIRDTISEQMGLLRSENKSYSDSLRKETAESLSNQTKKLENRLSSFESNTEQKLHAVRSTVSEQMSLLRNENKSHSDSLRKETTGNLSDQTKKLESRLGSFESNTEQKLQSMRATIAEQLGQLRSDNQHQLDEIRSTVDEKLQSTLEKKLNDSFHQVSERLRQVYEGLGEMKNVAEGVGDLKKVLSNVKTRGILGEIQLGAILKEILTAEQYEENAAVVPNSANRVEFAVKLPGSEDGKYVYLPIDSKFNGDKFLRLQEAYDSGDKEIVDSAKKELYRAIEQCAKDIRDKYIFPPYTTQFGIMFLPFEGLYAETVNSGLVEKLQREYHVNIAGPSTMAAMLNSLQMGFKTLAIQKRSGEVWELLDGVKTEFVKFEDALEKAKKHIRSVEKDLDDLVGTRTRAINRKLSKIDRSTPAIE